MPIFSRKSKGNKGVESAEKNEKKAKLGKEQAAPDARPAQPQSQDASSYARRESVAKAPKMDTIPSVKGNTSQAMIVPPNAIQNHNYNLAPSPVSGHQTRRAQSMSRRNSGEVYITDPDAPPMPSSQSAQPSRLPTPRGPSRDTNGYFARSSSQSQPGEGPAIGNPKMALAARDRGYISVHHSADSGYGSTAHSRAPSEQGPADVTGLQLSRSDNELLPQLSLSEELARDPVFSIASFQGEEPGELTLKRAPEGVLRTSKANATTLDHNYETRVPRSSRSGKKHTRFEDAPTAVTTWDDQSGSDAPVSGEGGPESATLPPQQRQLDLMKPLASCDVPQDVDFGFPFTAARGSPAYHPQDSFAVAQPQMSRSTPLPTGERGHEHTYASSQHSAPAGQSNVTSLARIISNRSIPNLPPLRILDGFKVNKRGNILDEEGDIIGVLYEGDIIDCVRQRVNGYGEVLDDYGTVVGRVRTVQRGLESSIARAAAGQPSTQLLGQQAQYQPLRITQAMTDTTDHEHVRRKSEASRSEAFSPTWQQQGRIGHGMASEELRDHLALAAPETNIQPIQPLDFPGNVTAVELGARSTGREEDPLPVLDYSEIFMPTPFVPTRSAPRALSTVPVEHSHARSISQPRLTAQNPYPDLDQQDAQKKSKHTSAPTPPAQQERELQYVSASNAVDDGPDLERQQETLAVNDRNGYEPSKSYTRPTISPVLEDTHSIREQPGAPASMFSYKGEIPARDGPAADARSDAVRQPELPQVGVFQRQISSGSVNSAQYSFAGSFGPSGKTPRQFSTGVPGMKPMFHTKTSNNAPFVKSPLSSHETSPPDSDNGSWDGDAYAHTTYAGQQPSLRSVNTARTTTTTTTTTMNSARPRTYFTHNGRVTSDETSAPAKEAAVAAAAKTATPVPAVSSVEAKKRSRFSFRVNKK
ncbi:Protein of unknown function (DUF3659) [Teratosphaeria destructans]|uniref:Uncharacterized protein n=1 Tax=Teratosphaeria destructans TaxID=418781 RepID=A0A9W7W2A0_9PEZI|nr:Protein of unknown function (DUF3659) [Teratosphaeria destructans]